jgi:predicted nucleic-acid-binding protein
MIAIDANIVVRLLTGDDKQQFKKTLTLFESYDVFIPDSVILETEWVLRYAYSFTPDQICNAFNKLFGLPNVHTNKSTLISQAIQWHENGLDFADALHLSLSEQHDRLFTFDSRFVRKARGLSKCSVVKP